MAVVRGTALREDVGHLTDTEWLYAAKVARQREWFPSAEQLLEIVRMAPRSGPTEERLALPAGETGRQRDEGRAMARRGLEMIEQVLRERGIEVRRPEDMPDPARDERIRMLRAQATELVTPGKGE